jgi:hypothetical protein
MPRNGDGSGDSGPYEGHDIVHGATGDVRLLLAIIILLASPRKYSHRIAGDAPAYKESCPNA